MMICSSRGSLRKRKSAALTPVLLAAFCVLSGCTTADVLVPVPESQVGYAAIDPFRNIRFWADEPAISYAEIEKKRVEKIRAVYGDRLRNRVVPINYLCVSGGGSSGAFGAGFLVGWTAKGTRPQFNAVTGISTGSMIAPLAFLGSKYDDKLKEAYTTISTEDVAKAQVLPALFGRVSGLADTAPLKKLIARFLTQTMLDEIAVESRKGRVLLIGTTNLESQRPIIWDIGAIAESGHPQSLELVREIILASASIPGAFPPVNVSVTADGKPYNEMHVDGGVTRQVFLYPPTYSPKAIDKAIGWKAKRTAYIIRNNKIEPEYAVVKPKLISVAGRSIDTLIKSDGIGDLYRIYAVTQRDKVDYNYISIPSDFSVQSKSAFDKVYMGALFEAGYDAALQAEPWKHQPPGL
jgi:predicted acylesterase/phospholipase RssA